MSAWLQRLWYAPRLPPGGYGLVPLSWVFAAMVWLRRNAYRIGLLRVQRVPVPVIVIGNLTVGGAGKTPLTIWIVDALRRAGFKPGVVSRGYGRADNAVREVTAASTPEQVGDEPLLLATRLGCPLAVGADRVAAVHRLLAGENKIDVVVCDDGLQHYRLGRDVEIAVIDGERGFGNGWLLPAGPLREPRARLRDVSATVYNGGEREGQRMRLIAGEPCSLCDGMRRPWNTFAERPVHAVAGIAYPERFFKMLRGLGLQVTAHPFPDHYQFRAQDVCFEDDYAVLMTEKDAVKCRAFADVRHWYVPVDACLEESLQQSLYRALCQELAPRFSQAARKLQDVHSGMT